MPGEPLVDSRFERLRRWCRGGCDSDWEAPSLSLSAMDAADGEGASIDLLLRWVVLPLARVFLEAKEVCRGGNNLLSAERLSDDAVLDEVDILRPAFV